MEMPGRAPAGDLRGRGGAIARPGSNYTVLPTIVRVLVPSPLRSYTHDAAAVSADGETLAEVVGDLDRRYPGIRFRIIDEHGRIRQHIKFFVNGAQAPDLTPSLTGTDEVMIVCALSGG